MKEHIKDGDLHLHITSLEDHLGTLFTAHLTDTYGLIRVTESADTREEAIQKLKDKISDAMKFIGNI